MGLCSKFCYLLEMTIIDMRMHAEHPLEDFLNVLLEVPGEWFVCSSSTGNGVSMYIMPLHNIYVSCRVMSVALPNEAGNISSLFS